MSRKRAGLVCVLGCDVAQARRSPVRHQRDSRLVRRRVSTLVEHTACAMTHLDASPGLSAFRPRAAPR
eukprot:scaffold277_cov261-Pinguiococcus_pyrenoidosus.AAC.16